jgi:hypothetical protein
VTGQERAAIRRLRAGVVPPWELERLSVGYDSIRSTINAALGALKQRKQPEPLFVRGEWGTGKTHCLSVIRASADHELIPNATVDLNGRSGALNYPQRFYGNLVETLRLQTRLGLRSVLLAVLQNEAKRSGLASFANSSAAGSLAAPLRSLIAKHESGEALMADEDRAWFSLTGGDIAWADYAYKRTEALSRIAVLARLCVAVGLGGLVVVFDEAETIEQLWDIRSRRGAYNVLGHLCRCQGLWAVFSITHRFERVIASDLAAGILNDGGIGSEGAWFLSAWSRRELPKVSPPSVDPTNAYDLAQRVSALYSSAYPKAPADKELVVRCVKEWTNNPTQNPRRLIRVLVHRLDAARAL